MGERIKITESERNRIKGLYEQEETKKCTIDYSSVFIPIHRFVFDVRDTKGRKYSVTISERERGFKITGVDYDDDDNHEGQEDEKYSRQEVIDFVNAEFKNGLLSNLPDGISWNKLTKKPDYIGVTG